MVMTFSRKSLKTETSGLDSARARRSSPLMSEALAADDNGKPSATMISPAIV
jgi:hypothetical protein